MNYIFLFKLFLAGLIFLVGAIIINFVANYLGLTTWYSFLSEIGKLGFLKSFNKENFISLIFLFLVYPFLLGVLCYFLVKFIF